MSPFEKVGDRWQQKRMISVNDEQVELQKQRVSHGRMGGLATAKVNAEHRSSSGAAPLQQRSSSGQENQNQNQNQNQMLAKLASEHLLSEESIEELQKEYPELDVRLLMMPAARKCFERYPNGGPMKLPFFREFLERESQNLDPPGLIESKKDKSDQLIEAARHRAEADRQREMVDPEEEDRQRKEVAEGLRKFREQKLKP